MNNKAERLAFRLLILLCSALLLVAAAAYFVDFGDREVTMFAVGLGGAGVMSHLFGIFLHVVRL